MNVRHPMGVLHSFAIKNVFFNDKKDQIKALFIFLRQYIHTHMHTATCIIYICAHISKYANVHIIH